MTRQLLVTFLLAAAARAQTPPPQAAPAPAGPAPSAVAAEVFRRFADGVVKIQVVETGSAAKAELGSGFFVTPRGHVVTNYHVVSKVVQHPERYRGEMLDRAGGTRPVRVLAVDVIHDVAVLATDATPALSFTLGAVRPSQGDRLYSLGHPHDLGLSIVEGTYNGLLQHTLYPKIHFTGAINPGMSGGPTLTERGQVVGINVRTAGNELSFLVPVDRAEALLSAVLAPGFAPPKDFLADIARQLREHQQRYLANMFGPGTPTVTLGRFTLPTEPAPFFKCWADAQREKDEPYQVVDHQCSTDDYIFLSGEQSSGTVELQHELITSKELNPLRFFSLYASHFGSGQFEMPGSEEEVTPFKCETRNVRRGTGTGTVTLRAVFCVRRYKRLDGLYDAVLKTAVLGASDTGVVTTLTLAGVSFENARAVARRCLERIAWRG